MNRFLDKLTLPGLLYLFVGANLLGFLANAVADELSHTVSVVENKNDVSIDPDNVVLMPFEVTVRGCSDSKGTLDYFFEYERSPGDNKTIIQSASWGREDTAAPIIAKGRVHLTSSEEYIDYNFKEVTHFVCYD